MKKLSKLISIVMIMFLLVSAFQGTVFADDSTTATSVVDGINADTSTIDSSGMTAMASKVLGLIQIATAVIAVILIAVFGFKFVLGSAQEKADYQKSFIPLIVGVVVVFAASSIAKMIFGITGA